jgi:hypothetical protein
VLVATHLEARHDMMAALQREPFRADFMAPRSGRNRHAEVIDLAGIGRDYAVDVLAGALTPPLIADPALMTYAPDSFWRGDVFGPRRASVWCGRARHRCTVRTCNPSS